MKKRNKKKKRMMEIRHQNVTLILIFIRYKIQRDELERKCTNPPLLFRFQFFYFFYFREILHIFQLFDFLETITDSMQ